MQLLQQTKPLDVFVPHVIANTFGYNENQGPLPESAALSFIRNAAISFAERTQILKERVVIDLQCGLSEYPVETNNFETVLAISKAVVGTFSTDDPVCYFECGNRCASWSFGEVQFEFDDDLIRIHPAPVKDIPGGLILEVIKVPTRDACELDTQFYNKYFDAIVSGALAEIHLMPNRPWSSNAKADYRRKLFEEEVSRAVTRKVMNGGTQQLKMRPPGSFMTFKSQRRF